MPTDQSNQSEPVQAPAAVPAVPVVVAAAPARRGLPGLALAGIIVGGVLVAGALFGGGVAVGATLHHPGPNFSHGEMMGQQDDRGGRPDDRGDRMQGKPGQQGPGQGQFQQGSQQGPGQGQLQQGPQQGNQQPAPAPTSTN